MDLERKLKVALDESRLLILGAQVLFGFQFQAFFQEEFQSLPQDSQLVQCAGVILLVITISLLASPSLYHQIIFRGETRYGVLSYANWLTGTALLPFCCALGSAAFVTFGHLFGRAIGTAGGIVFFLIAFVFLYGIGLVLREARSPPMIDQQQTPLKTKIEQMLTEARVVIPGAQALLGFQLVATLTHTFGELPFSLRLIHAFGLCAVALSVVLLMTPATIHRITYGGDDNKDFFHLGSALVVAASVPLAVGIGADVTLVFYIVLKSLKIAATVGGLTLTFLWGIWLGYPLWLRGTRRYDEH